MNCNMCDRCITITNRENRVFDMTMGKGWNVFAQRMIVCVVCGNKRCPKATDHRFDCTHSNDLGQLGSRYY